MAYTPISDLITHHPQPSQGQVDLLAGWLRAVAYPRLPRTVNDARGRYDRVRARLAVQHMRDAQGDDLAPSGNYTHDCDDDQVPAASGSRPPDLPHELEAIHPATRLGEHSHRRIHHTSTPIGQMRAWLDASCGILPA